MLWLTLAGLAKGQTLHLLVVEEVLKLIHAVSDCGKGLAVDTMAWLISQSMHSEKMQARPALLGYWDTFQGPSRTRMRLFAC